MEPIFRDTCPSFTSLKKTGVYNFSVAAQMLLTCKDVIDRAQSAKMKIQ